MTRDELLIHTHDLSVRYSNGTVGLEGVSVKIFRGDFVAVLGPSGAGKSTFLRTLNRLVDPTAGQLTVLGRNVTHIAGRQLQQLRRQVGMVFQQFNLVERRTVLANVLAGRFRFTRFPLERFLSVMGTFSDSNRRFAMECLENVGIAHKASDRVDALSGGQRQRVAVARLLAQEPKVILADEPIASLDPRSADDVMNTLRRIHRTHQIPVIVNLHQVEVARQFASRVIALRAGKVAFDGPMSDFDPSHASALYDGAAPESRRTENSNPGRTNGGVEAAVQLSST